MPIAAQVVAKRLPRVLCSLHPTRKRSVHDLYRYRLDFETPEILHTSLETQPLDATFQLELVLMLNPRTTCAYWDR
ncbi:Uncharacterised protein [Vibrio cholerae]|nr:Uncharacterised protein [Vibrio cholerae]CSI36009.1 Uncharacterised protein [Vibrio cholerae]